MHGRAQIRAAIETALASLATPQAVYIERRHRLVADLLPAVLVHLTTSEAETDQMSTGSPYVTETNETIVVEIHASGDNGRTVAETIDQIELEVEAAIAAAMDIGQPLYLLLENLIPNGSEYEASVETETVLAVRSVSYLAMWRHVFGAPDNPEG